MDEIDHFFILFIRWQLIIRTVQHKHDLFFFVWYESKTNSGAAWSQSPEPVSAN